MYKWIIDSVGFKLKKLEILGMIKEMGQAKCFIMYFSQNLIDNILREK